MTRRWSARQRRKCCAKWATTSPRPVPAPAALERISAGEEIDLLITDYLMPGMRGSELVEEARRLRPGLPVLLMTGYANLAKGEAAGLPRLAKPFREADLARAVAALLGDEERPSGKPRLRSV